MSLLIPYIRRSSLKQKDNTSDETQRRMIAEYCQLYGHEIAQTKSDLKTGTTMVRQGFWEALRLLICLRCPAPPLPKRNREVYDRLNQPCACKDKAIGADGLIAYDLDRVGRDAQLLLWLAFEFLKSRNKDLIVLTGGGKLDTTSPTGRFLFVVLAGSAQFYRECFITRCNIARNQKAENKGYASGRPPYGLRAVSKRLVEDPEELQTYERMLQLRQKGLGYMRTARILNEEGHRRRNGKPWTNATVCMVLKSTKLRYWFQSGCSYNHMTGT